MQSLARIYGASQPGLPTIEFPSKYERSLRQIAELQGKVRACESDIKKFEKEIEAHSVRIAELMKEHEHGVPQDPSYGYSVTGINSTCV